MFECIVNIKDTTYYHYVQLMSVIIEFQIIIS